MAGTHIIQVVLQRHKSDCAVACLAMLLGTTYEDALLSFAHNVMAEGASIKQIKQAAKVMGSKLSWSKKLKDLETDTGIISMSSESWPMDHVAVLKDGLIIDTDATIWDSDVYLSTYGARVVSILRVEE